MLILCISIDRINIQKIIIQKIILFILFVQFDFVHFGFYCPPKNGIHPREAAAATERSPDDTAEAATLETEIADAFSADAAATRVQADRE